MSRRLFKIFMLVVFIAVSTHVLHANSESKSLTVQGKTNNSTNKLSYTRFVNMYYMSANAAYLWIIHSASISPSGWILNTTSSRALGGGQADATISTAELFGPHIHGQIYKNGGGGGTMPEFDVYGQHSGSLALDREKDKIAVGTSGTFALKENGSTVSGAYWKCYLQSASAPAWASGGGSIGLPTAGTTAPGNYIVEARSDSNNDKDKKTSTFTYIGVASVSAGTITSTTDSPGANETIYIAIGSSAFNVTATPEPSGSWPTSFPAWKLDDNAAGTTGSSTYSFNPTIADDYKVAAFCGSSYSKAMKVAVVEVASISGHGKTSTIENVPTTWDDAQTIYCAPYVDANLTATPNPTPTWPTDEPTWHCECSWPYCQHLTATGASCTFNSSGSGEYIVRSECGTSKKRIKIYNMVPKLYSVEFKDAITIKRDTGTQAAYSGAHWKDDNLDGDTNDANDARYPVAYVSTDKSSVSSVKFKTENGKSYDVTFTPKIRFDTSFFGSYSNIVSASASGSEISYTSSSTPPVKAVIQIPDQFESSAEVGYDSSYSTRWDISFNNEDDWIDISGNSSNELYLTLQSGATTAFETVLHIGCTNADGETTAAGVVADIWSEFSDRDVDRKDDNLLTYNGGTDCNGLAGLLKDETGDCRDWADFFLACLDAQGALAGYSTKRVVASYSSTYMLMKTWLFPGDTNDTTWVNAYSGSNPRYTQCNPVAGMPYQGDENPDAARFGFHQIVYHGTIGAYTYYDPTYGNKTDTKSTLAVAKNAYENSSVQGFLDDTSDEMKLNNISSLEISIP